MYQLPNRCSFSEFKISPKNWDQPGATTAKDWLIYYTFYSPDFLKGKRFQIRGMNQEKKLVQRRIRTKQIIDDEIQSLLEGFNPIKIYKTYATDSEVNPYTPFIKSLWTAVDKVRVSNNHLINLKSVVRGVEKSARQLNIHNLPVSTVTRKYFNMIFEKCYVNNKKFTGSTQNRYKKSLHRIYKELFKMEAVEFNPLALIDKVRATKRIRVMPTDSERKKINKHLKENHYHFWRAIQMFFHSGAREAEFMRLQSRDVFLKRQECIYTIYKGIEVREGVVRPIKNSVLPLWKEILKDAKPDDYIFSEGLIPGPNQIRQEQFTRRWRKYVKNPVSKGGLGINVDLYTLKHLNTTQVMDELDKFYNPAKDVAAMNAHNEAMVIEIYDKNHKARKDEKIKGIGNKF